MKVVIDLLRLERQRHKHRRVEPVGLPGGKNTYNRILLTVQPNLLPDNVRVAPKAAFPEVMRHDGNFVFADFAFFREKIAPQRKGESHHVVEAGSLYPRLHHLWVTRYG